MSDNEVTVECCTEECVSVMLDQYDDSPVVLYTEGPPGPPAYKKAGKVDGADFSGDPQKFTVVFETEAASDDYGVIFGSSDGRVFTYGEVTTEGFVIDSGAGEPLTGTVTWMLIFPGEVGV